MIGEAIYNLLSTKAELSALVSDRVSPIAFREAQPGKATYPAIAYNTRGLKPIGCRGGEATKTGVLEIGILAANTVELENVADTLIDTLGNYQGMHLGYSLTLQAIDDDFDENVEDIQGYYKALQFTVTATKLN